MDMVTNTGAMICVVREKLPKHIQLQRFSKIVVNDSKHRYEHDHCTDSTKPKLNVCPSYPSTFAKPELRVETLEPWVQATSCQI